MTQAHVGLAVALEQFAPAEALRHAALAEQHGFRGSMAADHYQPWVPQQGEASFVWSMLAALGERTTGDLGTGVACPSFRMHPAMVAQAAATVEALYPGRMWLGLGSGEALNEHMFGAYWPEAPERITMMFEAIELIQKLFTGKDVKHDGRYFKFHKTRLWTMPEVAPPIYVATAGPITAKRTGATVDGIITVAAPEAKVAGVLEKFAEGARSVGKDPDTMPKLLQIHLSWAPTDEEAMANAMAEWPNGGMKFPKQDIRSPYDFEQMAQLVRPEDFTGRMVISSDPDQHRAEIQKFLDLGIDRVYLHNVGRNQEQWMEVFGSEVLPKLTR
ncbi:G6PDH family F420-dependent oxidoreductase [Motilibacter rhizosphaerae]|uniref:G6PDH family F420-dependent oxidoreductase n=1 Tax=Motilibacter rhizosphaerae TaxID=598652 RepID=A0A4Q7NV22_9ACTN|nr:TIGR03557 family F420-dependent LLM class oxidoreductase [Motilibacter rhizosphaerae]RZS91086.1 G6PDH family F420-dependent oxidoreductase [Motilibacter rhizosphaerae]